MVGAVVPSHCLAAIGQSEVLVAVAARDHQVVGLGRDVSRGPAPRRVAPLEVAVDCAAALGRDAWEAERRQLQKEGTFKKV